MLHRSSPWPSTGSERTEEMNEIGLVLRAEADVEAAVIESDDRLESWREAIVEIRGARRERTEVRDLELADVCPCPGHERSSWIARLDGRVRREIAEGVEGQVRRAPRGVGDSDVERRQSRGVAHVGDAMTPGAGAGAVVQPADARDLERARVEDGLPARDRRAVRF